jgi:hypothetical protein
MVTKENQRFLLVYKVMNDIVKNRHLSNAMTLYLTRPWPAPLNLIMAVPIHMKN